MYDADLRAGRPPVRAPRRGGFTLVELMIVVAIIGILAAIAIPNFIDMMYKARRAEAYPNLEGIAVAELAYEAAKDAFVSSDGWYPDDLPGRAAREFERGSGFDVIAWSPDGPVRGSYRAVVNESGDAYGALYSTDVNGDGVLVIGYLLGESRFGRSTFVDPCPDAGHAKQDIPKGPQMSTLGAAPSAQLEGTTLTVTGNCNLNGATSAGQPAY